MKLPVVVKKRQRLFPLYAVISAVMLCISLLFMFFPFIPLFAEALSDRLLTAYMVIGGVCTMFFAFTTSSLIFSIASPKTAVKITKRGLYDHTVAGVGAGFIPKEAIISLKTFGSGKDAFLGVKLDEDGLDALSASKRVREEINRNINAGLPAIILKQSDISMPLNELVRTVLAALGEGDGTSADVKSKTASAEASETAGPDRAAAATAETRPFTPAVVKTPLRAEKEAPPAKASALRPETTQGILVMDEDEADEPVRPSFAAEKLILTPIPDEYGDGRERAPEKAARAEHRHKAAKKVEKDYYTENLKSVSDVEKDDDALLKGIFAPDAAADLKPDRGERERRTEEKPQTAVLEEKKPFTEHFTEFSEPLTEMAEETKPQAASAEPVPRPQAESLPHSIKTVDDLLAELHITVPSDKKDDANRGQ